MTLPAFPIDRRPAPPDVAWAVAAGAIGLLCALVSTPWAVLVCALAAFAVVCAISPAAALAIMLVLAPLRALIATESAFRLPLDIGQLAFTGVLASVFTARIVRGRGWRIAAPHIGRPVGLWPALLGFIAITGLTGFTALSFSSWLTEWLKWVQIALLVLVCGTLRASWRWLLFGLVVAGCVNAVIGLYQFFGGSGALHLLVNDRFFRAFGTFGQPNPFGGFMGIIAPVAAAMSLGAVRAAWAVWQRERRIASAALLEAAGYGAAFGLLAAALVASWSRGAWLAFAASLLVVAFAWPRRIAWGAAVVVCAAVFGAGAWAGGLLPASITDRLASAAADTFNITDVRGVNITPENYAVVERLAHWQAALNMARKYPFLGVGFGGYEAAYEGFRLLNWPFPLGHAHNYYLNLLAETGAVGLAAYLVLGGCAVSVAWRARAHPSSRASAAAVGILGSFAYIAVHSTTDNLYVNNLFLHIGVLFGVLSVLYTDVSHSGQPRGRHDTF
jgi:O-antigen ligase